MLGHKWQHFGSTVGKAHCSGALGHGSTNGRLPVQVTGNIFQCCEHLSQLGVNMLPFVLAHQRPSSLPEAYRPIVDKMRVPLALLRKLNALQGNTHSPLSLLNKIVAFEFLVLVSKDTGMGETCTNEPGVLRFQPTMVLGVPTRALQMSLPHFLKM